MYKTVWDMLWPYLLRYMAQRSADYLEQRRELKRQRQEEEAARSAELIGAIEAQMCPPPQTRFSVANALGFGLGGVLLGSVLGLILAKLLREKGWKED